MMIFKLNRGLQIILIFAGDLQTFSLNRYSHLLGIIAHGLPQHLG